MSTSRKILRNANYIFGSTLFSKIIGAIIIILLVRHLDLSEFGRYSFALSFMGLFVIVSDFGFDALMVREGARKPEYAKSYLMAFAKLRLILGISMLVSGIIVGYIVEKNTDSLLILAIVGATLVLDSMTGLFYSFFRAMEKMEYEALVQSSWKILQLTMVVTAIYLEMDLFLILSLIAISSVAKLLLSFILYSKRSRSMGKEKDLSSGKLLRNSIPFALYEILFKIQSNIVIVVLFLMGTQIDTGEYSAVYRLVTFFVILPVAFESALYPALSKLSVSSKKTHQIAAAKSIKFGLIAAIPLAIVMVLSSNFILETIFKEKLIGADAIMAVISIGLPLLFMNKIMRSILWSSDQQKNVARNVGISAIVTTVSAIVGIHYYGVLGAGLAFLAGEAVYFLMNYQVMNKKVVKINSVLWKPLISGSFAVFAIYGMPIFLGRLPPAWTLIMMSLGIYFGLIYILGAVTDYDQKIIMDVLFNRSPDKPQ